jgi:hypothetical protein
VFDLANNNNASLKPSLQTRPQPNPQIISRASSQNFSKESFLPLEADPSALQIEKSDRVYEKIRGWFPMLSEELRARMYVSSDRNLDTFLQMVQAGDIDIEATAVAAMLERRLNNNSTPAELEPVQRVSHSSRSGGRLKATRVALGYELLPSDTAPMFVPLWSNDDDELSIHFNFEQNSLRVEICVDISGNPLDQDRSHALVFPLKSIVPIRLFHGPDPSSEAFVVWNFPSLPMIQYAAERTDLREGQKRGFNWRRGVRDFTSSALGMSSSFLVQVHGSEIERLIGIANRLLRLQSSDRASPCEHLPINQLPLIVAKDDDRLVDVGWFFVNRHFAAILEQIHIDVLIQLACLLSSRQIFMHQLSIPMLEFIRNAHPASVTRVLLGKFQNSLSNDGGPISLDAMNLKAKLEKAIEEIKDESSIVPSQFETVHTSALDRHGGENLPVLHCIVTPLQTIFAGPKLELSNRVLRHYRDKANRFVRVKFADAEGNKIVARGMASIILPRVARCLDTGLSLPLIRRVRESFQFLCFSASQIRDHSAWFFSPENASDGVIPQHIRNFLGDFSSVHPAAKCAARLGQAMGTTYDILELQPDQIIRVPDIKTEDGRYMFTDGSGRMSRSLGKLAATQLRLENVPSVFQIRLGGCKGVLSVDRDDSAVPDKDIWVIVRDSMQKFASSHSRLEVMEWSRYSPEANLNKQLAILLSDLGIKPDVIEDQCSRGLQELRQLTSSDSHDVLGVLRVVDPFPIAPQTLVRDALASGCPPTEPFIAMLLHRIQDNGLRMFESYNHILMPESRYFIGVPDAETRVLSEGQVYIRPSAADRTGRFVPGRPIVGPIVVTRFPAHHPGDVRLLDAVDIPGLDHMVDCIVFPTHGDRDHPSEMSGGDVDGDHFLVIWNKALLPAKCHAPNVQNEPLSPSEMANYGNIIGENPDVPVTISQIKDFFLQYIEHDQLGLISNSFIAHWDIESQRSGTLSIKCLRLAELAAVAVDAAKSGKIPMLPQELEISHRSEFTNRGHILSRLQTLAQRQALEIQSKRPRLEDPVPLYYLLLENNSRFIIEAMELCQQFMIEFSNILRQYKTNDSNLTAFDLLTGSRSKRKDAFRIIQARNTECIRLHRRYKSLFEREFLDKYGENFFENTSAQAEMALKASAWYEAGYGVASQIKRDDPMHANALFFGWLMYEHLSRMMAERPDDSQGAPRTVLHIHPRFVPNLRIY